NGYRYYRSADIERLAFVNRARELGFSIASIDVLLRLADHPRDPCDAVDTLLAEQLDAVENRLQQLRKLQARLRQLQEACNGNHPIHECGILAALSSADD